MEIFIGLENKERGKQLNLKKMEVTIKVEKTVQLKTLEVFANVRYWEDSIINGVSDENGDLTPCRKGDLWCPIIDIDKGQILNWDNGKLGEIHFKVADECGWTIKDDNDERILGEEDGYVPKTLCPQENGYGDYIIMHIDTDGFIHKWDFNIDDFIDED